MGKSKARKKLRIFGTDLKFLRDPTCKNFEPLSIIGRYRKQYGSLKAGEVERIQLSVSTSSVIAESDQQNKSEEHLKNKMFRGQSDRIMVAIECFYRTVALECFFRKALPGSRFSKMLESMILMLQPPHDNLSSNAVIFASILPEELKAYLQYTTNPIALNLVFTLEIFSVSH